jgi:uncharacterized membrane protein YccC
VVLGVLLAIAIGDAFGLNALTVGLLTGISLAIGQFVLRLPRPAATQIPVSILVVMAALANHQDTYPGQRALDTVIGAAVGVVVSLAFPASRRTDARQTLERLGQALGSMLADMSAGLQTPWTTAQTAEWRRTARVARDRLVEDTKEAVGNGREAAQWNVRDRRHIAELGRYEDVLPRLERTAIGVSAISRGLDDHARLTGGEHRPMPDMAALLAALGTLIEAVVRDVLGQAESGEDTRALEEVQARRAPCARAAFRQAQRALGGAVAAVGDADGDRDQPDTEWMSYTALLVQVDRIVDDLRAPLPP